MILIYLCLKNSSYFSKTAFSSTRTFTLMSSVTKQFIPLDFFARKSHKNLCQETSESLLIIIWGDIDIINS